MYFVDLYIQILFVHKKHVVTLFVRHFACTLLRPQEVVVQTCSSTRYSICIHPLKAVTTMFCQICGLQHVEATDMCSPEVVLLNSLSSKLVRPKVCVAPLCSITNVCPNLSFPQPCLLSTVQSCVFKTYLACMSRWQPRVETFLVLQLSKLPVHWAFRIVHFDLCAVPWASKN